jgi:hypothetical protein
VEVRFVYGAGGLFTTTALNTDYGPAVVLVGACLSRRRAIVGALHIDLP